MKTCAHCGFRDATDVCNEGYPACAKCFSTDAKPRRHVPTPVRPSGIRSGVTARWGTRERVLSVVRSRGRCVTSEIAATLGIDLSNFAEYTALSSRLSYLRRTGVLLGEQIDPRSRRVGYVYRINPERVSP